MNIKIDRVIPAAVSDGPRPATSDEINSKSQQEEGVAALPLGPAAQVRLSESVGAQRVASSPQDGSGEVFDAELVRQIRDRLEQGTFKINYDDLARDLLEDALAFAGKVNFGRSIE